MTSVSSYRATPGGVVSIPLSDGRVGFGHILEMASPTADAEFFMVVYDHVADSLDEAMSSWQRAAGKPLILFALTLDALLYHEEWTILGTLPLPADVPWPAYKVTIGHGDNVVVEDHLSARQRPATEVEAAYVPYRRTVAPIRVQRALEAHLGLGEWTEKMEALQVSKIVRADSIF